MARAHIPIHDGYSVEPLTRKLFPELTPLMLDAFGHSVTPSYFQWKYLQNPAGEAIGCIARSQDDGTIAAFYGMIPEIYRFNGTKRRIYQSCDTMTHSQHRRKGLFRSLALMTYREALAADSKFMAFGFGGPTSTPGFLKMNWRVDFEIPHLFKPFPLTFQPLHYWGGHVEELDAPDEVLLRLVQGSAARMANSVEKDEPFVTWRLSNPRRKYQYLRDADRAYAIFYRADSSLFIFDFWEVAPGAGRKVVSALQRLSLAPRTKGILTFGQLGTPFQGHLGKYGFLRNPFRRGPASNRIPFITFNAGSIGERDWAITPFDHDSF